MGPKQRLRDIKIPELLGRFFWGREDFPYKKKRNEVVYVIGVVKGTPWIRLEIFAKSTIQTSRGAVGHEGGLINAIHSTEAAKK